MTDKSCLSTLNIGYAGKVNIKVKNKKTNQTLYSYTNHNEGNLPLFNFLALCLAGEYATADSQRPYKIKLFKNVNLENQKDRASVVTDELSAVSSFISINTAPDVYENSVTFHFIVPYAYITGESVNQICLYGAEEKLNENYSAYFYIIDSNNSGSGIQVTRALSNLSLMID